jgi:hypothetical protein
VNPRQRQASVSPDLTAAAAARLAAKLKGQRILNADEVEFLSGATLQFLRRNLAGNMFSQTAIEESVRFDVLAKRCSTRREAKGLSVPQLSRLLKVPQYRLKAVDQGRLHDVDPTVLRKYVDHLGLGSWFRRWARENRELVSRLGLAQPARGGRPNNEMHLTRSAMAGRRGPRR